DIWSPPLPPVCNTLDLAASGQAGCPSNDNGSAGIDLWVSPATAYRQKRERARRRKEEQLAKQMAELAQANRLSKNQDDSISAEAKQKSRGARRKLSDDQSASDEPQSAALAVPLPPSSPDLARPQSLLIPSLLPKGMLRTHPNDLASPELAEVREASVGLPGPGFGLDGPVSAENRSTEESSDVPFGLGLDLGFDFAQSTPRRNPLSGGSGSCMSSSILDIANFLERDIDVFTPRVATASTLRPSALSIPTSLPRRAAVDNGGFMTPRTTSKKQHELIDDILKLGF
ncbi:hypothetical protein H4R26_005947, partial [Coemansia thaxteri]